MSKEITRRQFLKLVGSLSVAGAVTAACGGQSTTPTPTIELTSTPPEPLVTNTSTPNIIETKTPVPATATVDVSPASDTKPVTETVEVTNTIPTENLGTMRPITIAAEGREGTVITAGIEMGFKDLDINGTKINLNLIVSDKIGDGIKGDKWTSTEAKEMVRDLFESILKARAGGLDYSEVDSGFEPINTMTVKNGGTVNVDVVPPGTILKSGLTRIIYAMGIYYTVKTDIVNNEATVIIEMDQQTGITYFTWRGFSEKYSTDRLDYMTNGDARLLDCMMGATFRTSARNGGAEMMPSKVLDKSNAISTFMFNRVDGVMKITPLFSWENIK